LVVVVVLAIAQVVALAYVQITITHISHETARSLSVDTRAPVESVPSSSGQHGLRVETHIVPDERGGRDVVIVRVTQADLAISPLFSWMLADVTLEAETRMLTEN